MLNGKFHGSFQENYESGKIYRKENFNKGYKIGNWQYYFENGILKMEGIYENNKQIGHWKRFFIRLCENSKLSCTFVHYFKKKEIS